MYVNYFRALTSLLINLFYIMNTKQKLKTTNLPSCSTLHIHRTLLCAAAGHNSKYNFILTRLNVNKYQPKWILYPKPDNYTIKKQHWWQNKNGYFNLDNREVWHCYLNAEWTSFTSNLNVWQTVASFSTIINRQTLKWMYYSK